MEKKVVRLCWNTNGWKSPSGPDGKSTNPSFEASNGFGHEEWLLDESKIINGYHYSFVEPLRKGSHEGESFQMYFFSLKDSKASSKYYLGYIDSVCCLTEEESERIQDIYRKNGWLDEMQDQVKSACPGFVLDDLFADSKLSHFNIKFKMSDVHFLPSPRIIAASDVYAGCNRYMLYDWKGDFMIENTMNEIVLRKGDKTSDGSVSILEEDRLCFLVHNIHGSSSGDRTISKELLREFINYHRLHPEDTAQQASRYLTGRSNIDRFEYGYESTLWKLAKLNQELSQRLINTVSANESTNLFQFVSFLKALRTKPFMILAGVSGTGKSRIIRKLAQASVTEEVQKQYDPESITNGFSRFELHKPANFEIVQVKPNWHNSLEVVGYKSNIGGAHYEYTPFVEFVVRAWKHPEVPFFLCLDEMNLAPVEQYFAEFLSAIESRSFEKGEYETDPIIKPFIEFGKDVCNSMINHLLGKVDADKLAANSLEYKLVSRFRNKGLTLPKNLFVLGTVNMDETTFSFSRKVLDRAMSIVMNDVDYNKFFKGLTDSDISEIDKKLSEYLINREIVGLDAEGNDLSAVEKYLTDINDALNNTPFKLGYRAANEALLYVSAHYKLKQMLFVDGFSEKALDEFTMMKILSRIEGDNRVVDTVIDKLQKVITSELPHSSKKLSEMKETLEQKHFVSFWV